MGRDKFFRGIFLLSFLAWTDGTGNTANSLVTCAACQTVQVKFDSWDCNVNCDVISSENDITVTSTLIRDLMKKLEELNSTVVKLEDKNKRLEVHQISEANCAFSVHLVTSVNINQNPVKFETVDLNICNGYSAATGISTPTLNGTYFLSLDGATGVNNGHLRIMRNDDILCQSWLTESGHGDVGTCSVTAVLSAGDSVRVTGSAESPGRLQGERAGFTGVMIRP